MEIGEVRPVTHGGCAALYLVETGMYGVTGYGGVYVIDSNSPAIIETGIGTNVESILGALDDIDIEPTDVGTIAVTHVHLDHAGGAGHLAAVCENATVVVSDRGAPHLVDPERLIAGTKAAVGDQWRHYREPRPITESRIVPLESGESVDLGDRELVCHPAPGHARHQLVFHVPSMDAVFTGDAAGLWFADAGSVYQTSPPPEFDLDQAIADLDTIRALEPRTLLYTHFGPVPYSDELVDDYATTLVEWVEAIEATRAETGSDEETIQRLIDRSDMIDLLGPEKGRAEVSLNVRGVLSYLDRRGG